MLARNICVQQIMFIPQFNTTNPPQPQKDTTPTKIEPTIPSTFVLFYLALSIKSAKISYLMPWPLVVAKSRNNLPMCSPVSVAFGYIFVKLSMAVAKPTCGRGIGRGNGVKWWSYVSVVRCGKYRLVKRQNNSQTSRPQCCRGLLVGTETGQTLDHPWHRWHLRNKEQGTERHRETARKTREKREKNERKTRENRD